MSTAPDVASDESATAENGSTHRSAQGQHDDILTALSAADPFLAKQGGVGIIQHAHFSR